MKKVILLSAGVACLLLIVVGCMFYPEIYFYWHFECEYDEYYQSYVLIDVKHWYKETLLLPEETPDGYPIKLVESVSRQENEKIKELIIPDTYEMAFKGFSSGLKSLEKISIGKTLCYGLGQGCFADNDNLINITVSPEHPIYTGDGNCIIEKHSNRLIAACKGSTIPTYTKIIGEAAFAGVDIKHLDVPESVEIIELSAFAQSSLESITLPKSVKEISYTAFSHCSILTVYCEYVSKPNGWEEGCFDDVAEVFWGHKTRKTGDGSLS